jgi:hypothetical protein
MNTKNENEYKGIKIIILRGQALNVTKEGECIA